MTKKVKIGVSTIVYRSAPYIEYALKAIENVADSFSIVYGRDLIIYPYIMENNIDKYDSDGTDEIVEKFVNVQEGRVPVSYVSVVDGYNIRSLMRQVSISNLPTDTDYVLVVDGDTIFDADEICLFREMVESSKAVIEGVFVRNLMFWKDMKHILDVSSTVEGFVRMFPYHLFRCHPDYSYNNSQCYGPSDSWFYGLDVAMVDNLSGILSGERVSLYDVEAEPVHVWHMGWVGTKEWMLEHLLCAFRRDIYNSGGSASPDPAFENLRNIKDPVELEEKILGYTKLYHKLYTGVYNEANGEHVCEYSGHYPDILRAHPFFNLTEEELLDKDFYEL